MANNSVLTSSLENRKDQPLLKPVWERKVTFTIETGGGHAELSHEVLVNGTLKDITIEVGAAAGITGTANVDFDDNNGVEFNANNALAEGSETIVAPDKVVDNFTIRVDPSAAPTSGDWTIIVTAKGI